MLKNEIIQAVESGKFHIWSVDSIDEGIEILTGREAGQRAEDGSWPENSVNDLVDRQLVKLAEVAEKKKKPAEDDT
jgi:predicted ATP-dependent protease